MTRRGVRPDREDCYSRSVVPYPRATGGPATLLTLMMGFLLALPGDAPGQSVAHPLDFFQPPVTINPRERSRLDEGAVVVKTLDARARDVAIFAAAEIDTSGDRLVSWVRRIEALKRGPHVHAIARFSHPPRLEDLAAVALDDDEIDALRSCRPGSCGLKVSQDEIRMLRAIADRRGAGWRSDLQEAFRRALLARATTYLERGMGGLPAPGDTSTALLPEQEAASIASMLPFLAHQLPAHMEFLRAFPTAPAAGVESFLYWARESLGGKPVISITHVTISRPGGPARPDAIVVARQVYASHYMTGALGVTAIVGGRGGAPSYLAYLNRSRLDVLDGPFGGLVRRIVERRLRNEAGQVIDALRRRLRSGEP